MNSLCIPCEDFECKYEEIEVESKYSFDRKKQQPIFGQARCKWKLIVFNKFHIGVLECVDCERYEPRY